MRSRFHFLWWRSHYSPSSGVVVRLLNMRPSTQYDYGIVPSHRTLISAAMTGIDTLAIGMLLFFAVTSTTRGRVSLLLASLACAIIIGITGQISGLYAAKSEQNIIRTGATAVRVSVAIAVLITIVAWVADSAEAAAKIGLAGAAATTSTALARTLCLASLRSGIITLRERVLVVGRPDIIARMAATANQVSSPRVVAYIAVGIENTAQLPFPCLASFDVIGSSFDTEVLGGLVQGARFDRIIIAGAGLDEASIAALICLLEHLPFEIGLAPSCSVLGEANSPLDATECLTLRRSAMTPAGLAMKRLFDIAGSMLLLLLALPIMLSIAVIIRLESPGPAIFRQIRWGWNNEPFIVFKFRTMWTGAHGADGSVQAVRGDTRVTPFGAFLRRTSLDELPQLLNVLSGTMSLVGPRPHPAELNRRFANLIDRYLARHRVLPGITGWAQVNGFRGETSTNIEMQRRIDLDLEYIRIRSLSFDLWILIRTIASVIGGSNAH